MECVSYKNLLNKRNINIIDLQSKEDFESGHFNGAINMSYDFILENYRNLFNKNDIYYFYCYSGKLSKRIVMILSSLGYNAIMLVK